MLVGKGRERVEKMGYGGAESVSFFFFFLKKNYLSETREGILSGDRSLSVRYEMSPDQ